MSKLMKQAQGDLDALIKCAGPSNKSRIVLETVKQVMKPMLAVLGASAATGGLAYYLSKKDKVRHDQELYDSARTLLNKQPDLQKSPALFMERFGELSAISPTIAKNPTLASKLLQRKIKSGFDVDDIHKLTSIEANAARGGGMMNPGAAGRASAGSALRTLTQTFGSDLVRNYQNAMHTQHEQLADIENEEKEELRAMFTAAANEALDKKGHAMEDTKQKVSDSCLGQMLAERYVMLKTAGVADFLHAGAKNMGKSLSYFAPALALGGGIALIQHVIENRRNAALEEQADLNFKNIVKNNDIVKGNLAWATEGFNTLKAVAPSLAARPGVAETFVEHVANQARISPETISQLAEAENQIRGIGGPASKKGTFFGDLKSTMGLMDHKQIQGIEAGISKRPKKGYL